MYSYKGQILRIVSIMEYMFYIVNLGNGKGRGSLGRSCCCGSCRMAGRLGRMWGMWSRLGRGMCRVGTRECLWGRVLGLLCLGIGLLKYKIH